MQPLDDVRSHHREDALQRGVNPRDVDLLLSDLLGKPLSWLVAYGETMIDPAPLEALLARRYGGEPLQYIRRKTEFYSREFYVDDRVLIPRPETELLAEAALERAPRGGSVIDVGSGSGCIAITIERERPDLRVFSVDRSLDALAVATRNGARLESRAAVSGL
jgi:release factor glutamine methyltransferase